MPGSVLSALRRFNPCKLTTHTTHIPVKDEKTEIIKLNHLAKFTQLVSKV